MRTLISGLICFLLQKMGGLGHERLLEKRRRLALTGSAKRFATQQLPFIECLCVFILQKRLPGGKYYVAHFADGELRFKKGDVSSPSRTAAGRSAPHGPSVRLTQ